MEVINQGIAWGWWPNVNWLGIGGVILIIIIGIYGLRWETVLIMIGGLSNLMNRWQKGGIADYWRLAGGLWFNLADVLIMIGVGSLLLKHLWNRK